VAKLALTAAAAGSTAYSGVLGMRVKRHEAEGAAGATEPGANASDDLVSAQRQLKLLQWVTPALTGAALVLGAVHGEQQRGPAGWLDYSARDVGEAAVRTLKKRVA
jgi:hypothetical protein